MENEIAQASSSHLVVQSNSLVEAQYKLPVIAQKIIRKVISMIKPTDSAFEKYYYRLSVKDMADLLKDSEIEIGGSFYKYVKHAITALQTTIVSIPKHEDEKSWLRSTWFSSAEYNHESGYYEFEFSSKLEGELLKLTKFFTQYLLENISGLGSQYSIRIYELLIQIRNQRIKERTILLHKLKAMMGIEPNQYALYSNFKIRVLDVAKAEVSRKTDINFDFHPIKTGRKVTAIKFILLEKKAIEQTSPEEQQILDQIPVQQPKKTLKKAVRKAVKTHGIEGVQEIVTEVTTRHSNGKVEKVGAYLTACLNNGYGVKTPEEREAEAEEKKKELERKKALLKKQAAELEKAQKDLEEKEKQRKINLEIDSLPKEERERLKAEAERRVLAKHGPKPMGLNTHVDFTLREIFAEWKNQSEPTQMELFSHQTDKNA